VFAAWEGVMVYRMRVVVVALLLCLAGLTVAKEKNKPALPAYVLDAKTIMVMIDPEAGISMSDPGGNRTAQSDVEKALMKWGRYTPVISMPAADLIIVIRKGSGKAVQPTIGGVPTNDRPIVVNPTDTGIHIGAQQGHPPGDTQVDASNTKASKGAGVAPPEDLFAVYDAHTERPTDGPPVWRYMAKNGLRSPEVPAVGEFRKVVEEALKQQQQQKKKTP
jgi:hypothetical protein